MKPAQKGTLYGIGVGPGDPELLTLKAVRQLGRARHIFAISANGAPSQAARIAAPFMRADAQCITLPVAMRDTGHMRARSYDLAAGQIAGRLESGADACLLCEGDPLLYGSFIGFFERLAGRFSCIVIPGIPALCACAAVARFVIAQGTQTVTIMPATLDSDALRAAINAANTSAIIKIGRHLGRVRTLLSDMNLLEGATLVERAGTGQQKIIALAGDTRRAAPYFSMALVHATHLVNRP